jgi:hypothetical protein
MAVSVIISRFDLKLDPSHNAQKCYDVTISLWSKDGCLPSFLLDSRSEPSFFVVDSIKRQFETQLPRRMVAMYNDDQIHKVQEILIEGHKD